MKPIYSYALLAALAAVGSASAQVTATTTPVGYMTIDVPASADTNFTPALEQSPLLSAASTSISGNVVGAAGLTSGAFVGAGPNPKCYLQVTSGSLVGKTYVITANDATTITVDGGATTLQTQGFASGNTFKVIPFWTLNTLLPGGVGVGTTSDALNPTAFVFTNENNVTGANRAITKAYFYCTGDTENALPAGWYDNDDVFSGPVNDVIIKPLSMYTIRTSSLVPQSVVVNGQVPSVTVKGSVVVDTDVNDNYLGTPYPIDTSWEESGLQSVIQASTDVLNPVETIFVFDDSASGYNKAASKAYFYCSGDVENALPAGWYDNDDVFSGPIPSTSKLVKAGRCLVLRKAPYVTAGTLSWTSTIPYTL